MLTLTSDVPKPQLHFSETKLSRKLWILGYLIGLNILQVACSEENPAREMVSKETNCSKTLGGFSLMKYFDIGGSGGGLVPLHLEGGRRKGGRGGED